MGDLIPLIVPITMRVALFLFALVAAASAATSVPKTIEIKCIEMPKRRDRVSWPEQPKDSILDFEKLEALKKNLEAKNNAIKEKQKPATILNLDALKSKFSSKLAEQFKDFSMADMKKRKKMMMFMN